MNEKKLQQYAELLVKEGVRVQKNEELRTAFERGLFLCAR